MFASDRTADQLQMFLVLNSAAGLSGVASIPDFQARTTVTPEMSPCPAHCREAAP